MKFLDSSKTKSGGIDSFTAVFQVDSTNVAAAKSSCSNNNIGREASIGDRLRGNDKTPRSNSSASANSNNNLLNNMTANYSKSKSRPIVWALSVLAVLVCVWLCAVFFLLPSESRIIGNNSGWTESSDDSNLNSRPIIGILAQEYYGTCSSKKPTGEQQVKKNDSSIRYYIAASYVKFIEGAGARVVPILVGKNYNETYWRRIFNSVNGILFPGGAVNFDDSQFGKAGRFLYKLAIDANDKGNYFPIWGTCLGFEFMLYTAAGSKEIRANCGAWDVVNRLKFTDGASQSRLFGKAGKNVIKALGTKEVTVNFHHFCVTQENFTAFNLDKSYNTLSVNYDAASKLTYISSVEHKNYPFYAVQFHPEKNLYEWTLKEKIPHSKEAINVAQYFANFFVREAKKNQQKFETEEDEHKNLFYNFNPEYSGATGCTFEQLYFFYD